MLRQTSTPLPDRLSSERVLRVPARFPGRLVCCVPPSLFASMLSSHLAASAARNPLKGEGVHYSNEPRQCCGHGTEVSRAGACTTPTCTCFCRRYCEHLQVTVPGEARRAARLHGAPLHGWCRRCRVPVDDLHIRKLHRSRDSRKAVYWIGEPRANADDPEPVLPQADEGRAIPASSDRGVQMVLFQTPDRE